MRKVGKKKKRKALPSYRQLGFVSYAAYLSSGLWASIRSRVLSRDKRLCKCCGGPANQVHHHSYDIAVMKGHADHLLISICETCHTLIEFDGDRKRTIEQVQAALLKLLAQLDNQATLVQLAGPRLMYEGGKRKSRFKKPRKLAPLDKPPTKWTKGDKPFVASGLKDVVAKMSKGPKNTSQLSPRLP